MKAKKKQPRVDPNRACELRASGLSLQAVGDILGCTRERVRQITRHLPKPKVTWKTPAPRKRIPKDSRTLKQIRGVLALALDTTLTTTDIAKRVGVDFDYAQRILTGTAWKDVSPDMPRRPKGLEICSASKSDFLKRASDLIRTGRSVPEIAATLGVVKYRIHYLLGYSAASSKCPLCGQPKPNHLVDCAVAEWRRIRNPVKRATRSPEAFRLKSVLRVLKDSGPLTKNELAKILDMKCNTMGSTLLRFQNKGHIVHDHQRVPKWSITDVGDRWLETNG